MLQRDLSSSHSLQRDISLLSYYCTGSTSLVNKYSILQCPAACDKHIDKRWKHERQSVILITIIEGFFGFIIVAGTVMYNVAQNTKTSG